MHLKDRYDTWGELIFVYGWDHFDRPAASPFYHVPEATNIG